MQVVKRPKYDGKGLEDGIGSHFFLQTSTQPPPAYPTAHITPASGRSHNTRSSSQRHPEEPIFRIKFFQPSYFPCCIKIWNGLDPDLQNIDSDNEFKGTILPYIKIKANSALSMHDMYGVKLPSRFRLNFSHLKEHKIFHGFKDGTNCMRDCGSATNATLHFLLQCQQYQTSRLELLTVFIILIPR